MTALLFLSPRWTRLLVLLILGSVAAGWLAPARGAAAEVVGSGSPASCTDSAWTAAILAVDPGGTILFNCGSAPYTLLVSTQVIDKPVTVDGQNRITLDGGGTLQPFYVMSSGDLTLLNLVITHGDFTSGGAILNSGKTTIENVSLINNTASGGRGAGIYNQGTLVVRNSVIANNTATFSGGAIYSQGGSVLVTSSELNNNRAGTGGGITIVAGTADISANLLIGNGYGSAVAGGGIYSSGTLTLTNNTFAGNFAETGGALYTSGTTLMQNNTFHINRADIGGAVFINFGTTQARNTIFSSSLSLDGTYNSLNCDGPNLISFGGNLSSDNSCGTLAASDHPATDPLLAPLQNNGGPTLTHRPMPGSPVIDVGVSAGCPSVDNRGFPRPTGAGCDIGAVEVGYWVFLPLLDR